MSNECAHTGPDRELILKNIQQHDCHLVLVQPDNYLPGFVYSIGLFEKFNHPEIICIGLEINLMAALINDVCAQIKEGKKFISGRRYSEIIRDYDVEFLEAAPLHYDGYVNYATWYYKEIEFPVRQMVWPDSKGLFPWEDGVEIDTKFTQFLLDRNFDYKFYEERTLSVFTSKQAFKGEDILYVYHEGDGTWQFHTSSEPDISDGIIVGLEQITSLDSTINDVYNLKYNWCAWREHKGAEWQYEKYDDDEMRC